MDYIKRKTCKSEFEIIDDLRETNLAWSRKTKQLEAQVKDLQSKIEDKDKSIASLNKALDQESSYRYQCERDMKTQEFSLKVKGFEADMHKFLFNHVVNTADKNAIDPLVIKILKHFKIPTEMNDSDLKRLYEYRTKDKDVLNKVFYNDPNLYNMYWNIVRELIKPKESWKAKSPVDSYDEKFRKMQQMASELGIDLSTLGFDISDIHKEYKDVKKAQEFLNRSR